MNLFKIIIVYKLYNNIIYVCKVLLGTHNLLRSSCRMMRIIIQMCISYINSKYTVAGVT